LKADRTRIGIVVGQLSFGGIPEIIKDGENGFLVPYGDWHSFADKVLLLARDERIRLMMEKHAFTESEQYDISVYHSNLLRIYECAHYGVSL